MEEKISALREKVAEAAAASPFQGLLLGGLDSAILACLNTEAVCITVSLGENSGDITSAMLLQTCLNLKMHHRKVEIDEAIEAIPVVIKMLKSFDPALPNDLAVYFGLEAARKLGLDTIATGDGSDELFAGYSFMEKIDNPEEYMSRISKRMRFSSNAIGKFMGIQIIQPFMDNSVMDHALQIPANLKIRKEKHKTWGKWILRKSFEDILPEKLAWQDKRPLETGSGMTKLRSILADKISDSEFEKNPFHVKFFNKEHLYYYKIYREVVGNIPSSGDGEKPCPGCGGGMEQDGFHCRICGYVLELDTSRNQIPGQASTNAPWTG